MKETIKKLIHEKPKHYVKLISKNKDLMDWVLNNSLIQSDHLPSMIYSAINQESNICKNGNVKKFDRISTGFIGCGVSNKCKCTADNISTNVSKSKSKVSTDIKTISNNKRKETMLKKYGVEFNSQRHDMKNIWKRPKILPDIHTKLIDYNWLDTEYNVKKRSLSDIAMELGIDYTTVSDYCKKFNFTVRPSSPRSIEEYAIGTYIEQLGFSIESSNRTLIYPKELDIVIHDAKLAIEVNGLWWHSYNPSSGTIEDRYRHANKTVAVNDIGYTLLQITDYEWNNKQDIIKSMIRSRLNLNKKIHARKCKIFMVDKHTEKEFLNKYHMQGYITSQSAFGLFYENELVMMMSIGKSRYNSKYDYEILRMCAKSDITITGGVSKLVAHLKIMFPKSLIVSYCDLSKGNGRGYESSGFTNVGITQPGYFWTNGNIIISRYKTQKHKLKKILTTFDKNLSESINMFNAKYKRYWDCGNIIFTLNT